MTKKSRQKFKCLENIKSFYDEMKITFHHFYRIFTEVNKTNFFEGECPTLKLTEKSEKNHSGVKLRPTCV